MSKLITANQQHGIYKIANAKLRTLLATTAMTAAGPLPSTGRSTAYLIFTRTANAR